MSKIRETYQRLTTKSAVAFDRASQVLAGGTCRAAAFWRPHPVTIDRGEGAWITDIDGKRYIDMANNHASLVHGHSFPPILEAVRAQLDRGTAWSAGNQGQIELAEMMVARFPGIDQLRFTNSGTESALMAMAIARGLTGRTKFLLARFGYHGTQPETIAASFDKSHEDVVLGEFGDAASFKRILEQQGDEIAAVMIETMMSAAGVFEAPPDFFHEVRAAAHKAGALFVLDEVVTSRVALGGYKGKHGLQSDLTLFGKMIGGGFPVGAVAGPADIMGVFEKKDSPVYHSGTFNGNPVTMVAGAAALRALTAEEIDRLEALGARFQTGLLSAAERCGVPLSINRCGSLLNLFIQDPGPVGPGDRRDFKAMGRLYLAALNHGLFMTPRGWITLSTAMDDDLIDEAVQRAEQSLGDLAGEL